MSWPVTVVVTLVALFVLDRLLRRMEDRGWIHYRRFKPSGNGAANALAEFQERPAEEGAGAVVRLVLIGENLLQRSDLAVIFSGDAIDGVTPAGTCEGLRGDRDEAQLARILKGYSAPRLRACRERLLSLHGYPFKDPEERARSYHTPSLPPWAEGKDLVLAPRPENPAYRAQPIDAADCASRRGVDDRHGALRALDDETEVAGAAQRRGRRGICAGAQQ